MHVTDDMMRASVSPTNEGLEASTVAAQLIGEVWPILEYLVYRPIRTGLVFASKWAPNASVFGLWRSDSTSKSHSDECLLAQ